MSEKAERAPSFSSRRRWGIFFSVIISIVAMTALIGMLNYLAARYYTRMNWSAEGGIRLSPQTVGLLKSITNQVKVVVYYNKKDPLYTTIVGWLDEYRLTNPKISVQLVDYQLDIGAAARVKATYRLGAADDKDLVIFECEERFLRLPGNLLGNYEMMEQVSDEKERNFQKKLKSFNGESQFNGALLNVTSSKPLTAAYLQTHGEHPAMSEKNTGYSKFLDLLGQNNVKTTVLTNSLSTNTALSDYQLLIIAGPTQILHQSELDMIRQYLAQGGRMLVMFDHDTWNINTGLESLLSSDWGVQVGHNTVRDPQNSTSGEAGGDVEIREFNRKHEAVNRLMDSSLELILPRSVSKLNTDKQSPEAPNVEELAFTGEHAEIQDNLGGAFKPTGRKVPVAVAVEKSSVKGVFPARGTTRIVAMGDATALENLVIDFADNRDFARYTLNWLMDERQMMQGIGPRPVKEWKLMLTQSQMTSIRWIFLAGMPGAILALGGLVWLRRRH